MTRIHCPENRTARLRRQRLNLARAIIRRGVDRTRPLDIILACRALIAMSPHSFERRAARAALASAQRRAA